MKNLLVPFLLAGVMAPALAAAPSVPDAAQLKKMTQRYAPVQLTADASKLSAGDRKAIAKLIEAAKVIDTLQLRQRWSQNEALWAALKKDHSALGKARQEYFWLNKGPWSHLDDNTSFLPAEIGADSWSVWTSAVKEATGAKGKALFMPLRQAVTGMDHGPDMAALLPLIDRDRIVRRLKGETA